MTSKSSTWLGDAESKPAPGPLARVQALVNTAELPSGPDRLTDPDVARPWLTANDLLPETAQPTAADLTLIREVREGLRALLVHNAGGAAPTDAQLAPLRGVLADAQARADLAPDGELRLSAAGDSLPARLLELLLTVRDAQRDGSWARLKACANDECRWAFYDRSRNHGGTWCDMSTCGNKLKNRDFRARRRTGSGGQVPDQGGGQRAEPVQ